MMKKVHVLIKKNNDFFWQLNNTYQEFKWVCFWLKFILGLMFFELVSILFAIVPDYGNVYTTKQNKNWNSFKNFAPKLNFNHNRYMNCVSALHYITVVACWAEPFTEIYCFDSLQSFQ